MSLHDALSLAVADGMSRLVTFFPELMGQDYAFFVVELLGVLLNLLVQSKGVKDVGIRSSSLWFS